jgi:spermidine synthase
MKIWIGDQEADTSGFTLWLDGGTVLSNGKQARKLFSALELRDAKHLTCKTTDGERVGAVLSPTARLSYRTHGTRLELFGEAFDEPGGARLVRGLEGVALRIMPATVCLGDGAPQPYPPEGALFVRMTHSRQTSFQRIDVGEHPVYGRLLFLNGETQIASTDEALYTRSLIGPAMHQGVKRVLILGGGDCGALREVLDYPVDEVLMVEIDEAVIATAVEHFPEVVGDSRHDPRATVVIGDAFAYLKDNGDFDLIVYDLSDTPLGDDDAVFELIDGALADDGRVAVQCGSGLERYRKQLEKRLRGVRARFRKVKLKTVTIPSFLEQPWVFAFARKKRRKT